MGDMVDRGDTSVHIRWSSTLDTGQVQPSDALWDTIQSPLSRVLGAIQYLPDRQYRVTVYVESVADEDEALDVEQTDSSQGSLWPAGYTRAADTFFAGSAVVGLRESQSDSGPLPGAAFEPDGQPF